MSLASRPRLLPVVMAALAVVAALKLVDLWIGFNGARAQTVIASPQPAGAAPPAEKADQPQEAPAPELAPDETERRILERLAARRAALDAREENISAREAVIAAAEKRLGERIAEFERERNALLALRAEKEARDAAEIEALISAYEHMRAKDAAVIFNALDEDIMLAVASGMRTQALAGVLAEMQPEKARKLTVLLAERERAGDGAARESAPVQ